MTICNNCIHCHKDLTGYHCGVTDTDCEAVTWCREKRDTRDYNPYDDEDEYDDDFNNFDD